jgi:peptidyl-prolyl cis-trans isomerase SurA
MLSKKFLVYFLGIFLIFNAHSNSLENKILVKIEDQIITSVDLNNEYKYLIALNPNLNSAKKEDLIKLSKKINHTRKN